MSDHLQHARKQDLNDRLRLHQHLYRPLSCGMVGIINTIISFEVHSSGTDVGCSVIPVTHCQQKIPADIVWLNIDKRDESITSRWAN